MTRTFLITLSMALSALPVGAQNAPEAVNDTSAPMPGMPGMEIPSPSKTGPNPATGGMESMDPVMMRMMALDPDHMRMGSGTAWHPDSTPTAAFTRQLGDWSVMTHGSAWLTYNHTRSPRGVDRVVSQNWLMTMGQRPLAGGALMLRSMLSLDAGTIGGSGYPLLLQTGESWHGRPLLDMQHPHDLLMEVAADYSRPLTTDPMGPRWNLYLAPVGEPALGPEAFMHRQSAFEDPLAPISHHWQDATHISWGVATLGLSSRQWKLEGSAFNGHEPNENRWLPDPIRFNSTAARLWYMPSRDWSFQASTGRIANPEKVEPGDVTRHTASAQYNRPLADGNFAATAVWGQNREKHGNSDSYLLEANWSFKERNYLFTRMERVKKSGLFPQDDARHDTFFKVGAYTLGYARDIAKSHGLVTAAGIQGMVFSKPSALDEAYGRRPWTIYAFLRVRPKETPAMSHGMGGMGSMAGMPETPAAPPTPIKSPVVPPVTAPSAEAQSPAPLVVPLTVQAQITSAKVGANDVSISVRRGDTPVSGATVTLASAMATMDMGTERVSAREVSQGEYHAIVHFPMSGPWRVTVSASEGGQTVTRALDVNAR